MELIFVYNAEDHAMDRILGALHKVVAPKSYACDLCKLTHNAVGARRKWIAFLDSLSVPVRVMYKNTFREAFQEDFEFPVILSYENSQLTRILDKKELEDINDLSEFFVVLKRRLPVNLMK